MPRPKKHVTYNADAATVRATLREALAVDQEIKAAQARICALNASAGQRGVHPRVMSYIRRLAKLPPEQRRQMATLTRAYLAVLDRFD